jgi:hypothetical protein
LSSHQQNGSAIFLIARDFFRVRVAIEMEITRQRVRVRANADRRKIQSDARALTHAHQRTSSEGWYDVLGEWYVMARAINPPA